MGVSQRLQSAINSIIGDPQANDDLVALLNAAEGGTITSLGLAMPSIFTVLNSPITSSGTIGVVSNTQLANVIYAGPASGSAASPTFRAFNNNDLPSSISLTSNVSSPTITLTGSSGANLTWNVDGGGDIGTSSANRPNNGFFAGGLAVGNEAFQFGVLSGTVIAGDNSSGNKLYAYIGASQASQGIGQPDGQIGFFDYPSGEGPIWGMFHATNDMGLYNTGDAAGPLGGYYPALTLRMPSGGSPPYSGVTLLWGADGVGDIGAISSSRPNNIYALSKIIATGGLGVGNSVAATTPGSVVASIEIFDASGASLGFIPVYDSIS